MDPALHPRDKRSRTKLEREKTWNIWKKLSSRWSELSWNAEEAGINITRYHDTDITTFQPSTGLTVSEHDNLYFIVSLQSNTQPQGKDD